MATPTKVLDLDSLVNRPVVVIGGKEYWLVTPDILPPMDTHHVNRLVRRASELETKSELSSEEEEELKALPGRLCRLVLEAPADVVDTLSDRQKALITQTAMTTFQNGLRLTPPNAAPTPAVESSTGVS